MKYLVTYLIYEENEVNKLELSVRAACLNEAVEAAFIRLNVYIPVKTVKYELVKVELFKE